MIRRFKFEEAENEAPACVPMSIKRLLDRIGLKISRVQWGDLTRADREAIGALPLDSEPAITAARSFIGEIVLRTSGAVAAELPIEQRRLADPPAKPPEQLIERAAELGFQLGDAQWKRLGPEERYALTKLATGAKSDRKLTKALREFGVAGGRSSLATDSY